MESRAYCTSYEDEMSISDVIEENMLEVSLTERITNLFISVLC
jgi:hypothetical protein